MPHIHSFRPELPALRPRDPRISASFSPKLSAELREREGDLGGLRALRSWVSFLEDVETAGKTNNETWWCRHILSQILKIIFKEIKKDGE